MKNKHFVGLNDSEVLESRAKYGENVLTPPKKQSLFSLFLEKFKDPIIMILFVALLLSFAVSFYHFYAGGSAGDFAVFFEPIGILIAVLLATVVGFAFEVSANKKFDVLNQVNDDSSVKVIRNGAISQIHKKEIVVGDLVSLETGDEVPADGELLEAISLQINESTLTGEPVIKKTTNPENFDKHATYPSNHVMKGTTVVDGHGILKITMVGDATEYGKVYEGSQIDNSVETPLNIQLKRLASMITKASYIIASLIILGRMIQYYISGGFGVEFNWIEFGSYILNTVMIAVTVIVVAVPEGLPMSVTLSLAMSMKRMLASNNLVRKMHACETMGATTVICTDKTGTLTQNQMRIYESDFYGLNNQKFSEDRASFLVKEGISVNSTAHLDFSADKEKPTTLGNPTEAALLLWLNANNIDYLKIREETKVIEQLTFSTERKYMATIVDSPLLGKKVLYVKGAPEIVFAICSKVELPLGNVKSEDFRNELYNKLLTYQQQAMRTLGFAYQVLDKDGEYIKDGRLVNVDLTFIGITAISDPVRSDVPDAVRACLDAGIAVKIVTGDTPGTAKEIGRQIGLWKEEDTDYNHLSGPDFASLSDDALRKRILDLKIMSRARPMDKQRLVRLLQEKDQVVAVTGDGTNDAPALNAAQVGLSMGDGTSVAKEASDITIVDNSFKSISKAVMWGRTIYQNIQRFIIFQMTINVAACIIVFAGAFLGTDSPLTVTQMLWVNLIMDTFAALALASLPPTERVMKDKPRNPKDYIITKNMAKRIIGVGLLFVVLLFGLIQYFKHSDITTLRDFSASGFFNSFFDFSHGSGLTPYELSLFFTIFVILQFWNMFNAKAFLSGRSALNGLFKARGFIFISLVTVVGQWLIVSFGGKMFNVVPLSWTDWGLILASTSVVLWIGEIIRLFKWRK